MRQVKKLLSDWILVELEPVRQATNGGIVLPDPSAQPVRVGRVLRTGPGRRYIDKFVPMPDLVGKRVCFMIAAVHTKDGVSRRARMELKEHELIRLGDILLEIDDDVEVSK